MPEASPLHRHQDHLQDDASRQVSNRLVLLCMLAEQTACVIAFVSNKQYLYLNLFSLTGTKKLQRRISRKLKRLSI